VKGINNRLLRAFNVPFLIRIFDAQDELAIIVAGEKPVEERGARSTNM
jgi:hypothetical protein